MKALATITFVSATLAATNVMAADSLLGELPDYPQNVAQANHAQPRTRADVMAEYYATPFDGTELGEMPEYPQKYQAASRNAASGRTRAEVRAELVQAMADGTAQTGGIDYPVN